MELPAERNRGINQVAGNAFRTESDYSRPTNPCQNLSGSRGAFQLWGGNSLTGRPCRRWLELFAGSWRDSGHAPGLALAGGLSVRGHGAGTRPAPTGAVGGSNTGRRLNRADCPYRSGTRRGALRGESPRTREGRRPDRTTAVVRGQWSVVRGDGAWSARGCEFDLAFSLPEVYESSTPLWDARDHLRAL